MQGLRPLGTTLILIAVAILLSSCAGFQTLDTATPQEPAPKFRLSANGLAKTGMWKSTPLLIDINQDGHLDLAATIRLGDGPHVWLGDGNGNWTDFSEGLRMADGSCGGGLDVGDINGDGLLDLAVADHCTGVYAYLAQKGRWQAVTRALQPAKIESRPGDKSDETKSFFTGSEDLALGDINSDGKLDIVSAASDMGGFAVYLGDGTGKKWVEQPSNGLPDLLNPEPEDEDEGGWANQVDLVDMNGDGQLDVVAAYHKGPRVYLGDGKGRFTSSSAGLPTPQMGGLYRGITVGDFNGDGLLDFAAANDVDGPEVYFQQAGISWRFGGAVMPSMQHGAVGVAAGDFDKDGNLDLLVAGRKTKAMGNNYGLYLLKGDGKGSWKEIEATNLPAQGLSVAWGVTVGDVNEDGLLDLAAATGGMTTGTPGKFKPPNPKRAPKAEKQQPAKPRIEVIPELDLPRVQVWVNEGVK